MYADTADGLSVSATVPAVDGFGWRTFAAMEPKRVSQIVITVAGVLITVHTVTMCLSRVSQVLSQTLHYTTRQAFTGSWGTVSTDNMCRERFSSIQ